jgi:hypothetical protein
VPVGEAAQVDLRLGTLTTEPRALHARTET